MFDIDADLSIIHLVSIFIDLELISIRSHERTDRSFSFLSFLFEEKTNDISDRSFESRWNWLKEMCWCKKIFIRWVASNALASGRLPISIERWSHPIYFLLSRRWRRVEKNDCRRFFSVFCEWRRFFPNESKQCQKRRKRICSSTSASFFSFFFFFSSFFSSSASYFLLLSASFFGCDDGGRSTIERKMRMIKTNEQKTNSFYDEQWSLEEFRF